MTRTAGSSSSIFIAWSMASRACFRLPPGSRFSCAIKRKACDCLGSSFTACCKSASASWRIFVQVAFCEKPLATVAAVTDPRWKSVADRSCLAIRLLGSSRPFFSALSRSCTTLSRSAVVSAPSFASVALSRSSCPGPAANTKPTPITVKNTVAILHVIRRDIHTHSKVV